MIFEISLQLLCGWSQPHIKSEKSIFRPKLQKPTDRPCRIQNTEEENRKQKKRRIKKKNTERRRRIQNTEEEYRIQESPLRPPDHADPAEEFLHVEPH